jgi:hypothetical protein
MVSLHSTAMSLNVRTRRLPTRMPVLFVPLVLLVSLLLLGQSASAFRMAQYHQSMRRIMKSSFLTPRVVTEPSPPPPICLPSSALTMSQQITTSGDEPLVSSIAESVQVRTLGDETVSLAEVLRQEDDDDTAPIVFSCLSHFGDFNAWELTQQYVTALKSGGKLAQDEESSSSPARVVLVGIGSVAAANQFAKDLELQALIDAGRLTLAVDPEGTVAEALQCYNGWLSVDPVHRERYPQTDVSPYIKLLGMIFGFGSPGTIEKVAYGYLGDIGGNKGVDGRAWVVDSLLQGSSRGRFPKLTSEAFKETPITSSLRPFELATLRLQTGWHIVQNWGKLVPQEKTSGMTRAGDLLTRMGGTFVLDSDLKCQWSYFDQGILNYADVDEVCQVLRAVSNGEEYVPWTKQQKAALNQEREARVARQLRQQDAPVTMVAKTELKVEEPTVDTPTVPSTFFADGIEEVVEAPTELGAIEKESEEIQSDIMVMEEESSFQDSLEDLEEAIDSLQDSWEAREEAIVEDLDEEVVVEELEEVIVEELYEEAVEELEASIDEKEGEGAFVKTIDTLDENMLSSQPQVSEASIRAKELFQRSLLKAHLEYASALTGTEKPTEPNNSMRLSPPSPKKAYEEDNSADGAASSAIVNKKERFYRNLLQAQYRYSARSPTPPFQTEESPEYHEPSTVDTTPIHHDASPDDSKKEVFHRAMLQAQMQYKSS